MKTIELRIYEFEELSKDAQQRAIEKWIKSESEHGDPLYSFDEYCNEKANEAGFFGCKFQWSLSCCQGDGLSFSFERYDKLKELFERYTTKKRAAIIIDNLYFNKMGGNNGSYCYAHKSDIEIYVDDNYRVPNIDHIVSQVNDDLADVYMNLCKELEKDGYSELEYQLSEENARECIIANEYEFTEDGEIF